MFTRFHSRGFASKQAAAWKENWYFAVSAFCFFCLCLNGATFPLLGLQLFCALLGALAAVCLSAALPASIPELLKKAGWPNRLLSALSALGILQNAFQVFYRLYLPSGLAAGIAARFSIAPETLLGILGGLGAVCGFPALFSALSLFYAWLLRVLRETRPLKELRPWERRLYPALLAGLFLFAAAAFLKSDCFYSGGANGIAYNKIYSLDCGIVAEWQGSAFLNLRQHIAQGYMHPLFAAFSAPFAAIPALLALPFSHLPFFKPLLIQGVQLALLLLVCLLLARMMKLVPSERVWFVLLCCAAYPTLLFSVAMEKFILSAFWTVLFLSLFQERGTPDRLALAGAGGCVACGVFLLPLSTLPLLRRDPSRWLNEMVRGAAAFLLSLTALGRLDALLTIFLSPNTSSYRSYFGLDLPLFYRFQQYTAFVRGCFLAPEAAPLRDPEKWDRWWMLPIESIDLIGLGLLALCAASFWSHRREFIAQAAMGWAALSFVLFFFLGFDVPENSLVLFSLYFGWAFWVLLFLPVKRLRGKSLLLLSTLCAVLLCLLLARNLPQMAALLRFAAETYPAAG